MYCSKCAAQNPDHARFCMKCANRLEPAPITTTQADVQAPATAPPVPVVPVQAPPASGYVASIPLVVGEEPKRKRKRTVLIVVAVLAALLVPCIGLALAIGIPVFSAASTSAEERACYANQRVIEGAGQQWLAEDPDNDPVRLEGDGWKELLGIDYIKDVSTMVCPADGDEYAIVDGHATCPVHGSYVDGE